MKGGGYIDCVARKIQGSQGKQQNNRQHQKYHEAPPYKSFFYSVPEKQAFVQAKLDEKNIPYRKTKNGFETQECYVDEIRNIEKIREELNISYHLPNRKNRHFSTKKLFTNKLVCVILINNK